MAAAGRLVEARSNLARYRPPESSDLFSSLWAECEDALQESRNLREETARHGALHQKETGPSQMMAG
jgi:hypothetical protein